MSDTQRTYPYNTMTVGRWVLTYCRQSAGAPIVDSCSVWSVADGWNAGGIAIRLPRGPGRALVIARIDQRGPVFTAKACQHPLVGWLFRTRP